MMQKQVAHIVGGGGSVMKREPCQKCNLPVFLAERLTLGKKLFHRTCLKCARCESQLTPGNFYETEVDGEFCCETCPDEEKEFTLKERLKNDLVSRNDVNKSFSEKLAMFQTDGKGLLQKSLSDEEKSKSLKRLTELYSSQEQTYKSNKALSNFISKQVDADQSVPTTSSEKSEESSCSSDEESDNEDPPDLPATKPPSPTFSGNGLDPTSSSQASRFSNCIEIDIGGDSVAITHPEPINESQPIISNKNPSNLSEPYTNSTPVNVLNEKSIVTKEENKHDEGNDDAVDCVPPNQSPTGSGRTVNSMVRSRLSQFEMKIGADPQCTNKSFSKKLDLIETTRECRSDTPLDVQENDDDESRDCDKIDVPAADQIKLISSEEFSDIRKYEREETTHVNEVFEKNVKSQEKIDEDSTISSHSCLEDEEQPQSNQEELSQQLTESITLEGQPTEKIIDESTGDAELGEAELGEAHNVALIEATELTRTEVNIEIVEPVVPAPRKRISKINKEESEKPVPVKRTAKQNRLSKSAVAETTNPVIVKDSASYPLSLNPFGSDDEEDEVVPVPVNKSQDAKGLNPFDSSDDEIELEKNDSKKSIRSKDLSKSRISLNPFGSDTEDDDEDVRASIRTPVPTPRKVLTASLNTTPEPTPRLPRAPNKNDTSNVYGSEASLTCPSMYKTSDLTSKNCHFHGSTTSLSSSISSVHTRRKKGRAPLPPTFIAKSTNELSVSKESSPSQSARASPSPRKKRVAPAPPASTPKCSENNLQVPSINSIVLDTSGDTLYVTAVDHTINTDSDVLSEQSTLEISDVQRNDESLSQDDETANQSSVQVPTMRLIPLEASLLEDSQLDSIDSRNATENDSVIYRRRIIPLSPEPTSAEDSLNFPSEKSVDASDDIVEMNARQWQKVKENKESQNKNRQSQISLSSPESDHIYSNKSSYGKWKRRKGPAPALPVPPRKILQMVPLQEIRHELEVIEVQQVGLEKQGVMLEKMIRERCEGTDPQFNEFGQPELPPDTPNTKEVEDLILQLFELVNEKNELFRRQAELMYLRRQHRLEQEQADIEYEIRVLMAQPERNKTDCDKSREEALITRLVEVVQLRNEVIECLEMDRLREAEEDQSIKQRMELHSAKRDVELSKQTPTKLSKKEKKKQKESKKLFKQKKMDADKDADETEIVQVDKTKKKKRKFLF